MRDYKEFCVIISVSSREEKEPKYIFDWQVLIPSTFAFFFRISLYGQNHSLMLQRTFAYMYVTREIIDTFSALTKKLSVVG